MNKENCALNLVDEIILYYDVGRKKYLKNAIMIFLSSFSYNYQYREDTQQLREKS